MRLLPMGASVFSFIVHALSSLRDGFFHADSLLVFETYLSFICLFNSLSLLLFPLSLFIVSAVFFNTDHLYYNK